MRPLSIFHFRGIRGSFNGQTDLPRLLKWFTATYGREHPGAGASRPWTPLALGHECYEEKKEETEETLFEIHHILTDSLFRSNWITILDKNNVVNCGGGVIPDTMEGGQIRSVWSVRDYCRRIPRLLRPIGHQYSFFGACTGKPPYHSSFNA